MRRIALAALVVVLATPALAETDTEKALYVCAQKGGAFDLRTQAYYDCIHHQAAEFEPSGESAEAIATAVPAYCADAYNEVASLGAMCQVVFANTGVSWADKMRRIDENARQAATAIVVQLRLNRMKGR